jgi:DNA-binding CsgD family transcriptional regulator
MSLHPDGSDRGPFWPVFERSHIPMALLDRDRRYVAVNDAMVAIYEYRREDMIGSLAGTGLPDEVSPTRSAEWQELLRMGELYGERVIAHGSGAEMRVSYAAHATDIDGQWRALFVVLSAQLHPQGEELIGVSTAGRSGSGGPAASSQFSKVLTPREREVVRRVALGRSTPQIAVDLNLSPATVRSHVRNAMVKTDSHTRAQLVALVLGEGLAAD